MDAGYDDRLYIVSAEHKSREAFEKWLAQVRGAADLLWPQEAAVAAVVRSCVTCAHYDAPANLNPCKTCLGASDSPNWRPK